MNQWGHLKWNRKHFFALSGLPVAGFSYKFSSLTLTNRSATRRTGRRKGRMRDVDFSGECLTGSSQDSAGNVHRPSCEVLSHLVLFQGASEYVTGMFVVCEAWIFARIPLLGPDIPGGRCFGLHVKCHYLVTIATCVGREGLCAQVTALDNPAAGSRDKPGSVQWSIVKCPYFVTDLKEI